MSQMERIWSRNWIITKKAHGLVKKARYNADKSQIETKRKSVKDKIIDKSTFVKKTRIKKLESEIPKTNGLVKKTTYNTEKSTLKSKIINVEGIIPNPDNVMRNQISPQQLLK